MRDAIVAAAALMLMLPAVPRQVPAVGSLRSLVEAEQAFAESARRLGLRDSFLEFFADDAIALTPAAEPGKERLRARPARPFAELEITWEPRQGDVAASGDLGWLTGPSTIIDHTAAPAEPQYGNYLSVWRRQPDGRWRVYIDVGVQTPALPTFAPGFARRPDSRYTGPGGKAAATRTLAAADRLLNRQIGSQGAAAAFLDVALESSRLHRPEAAASVGRQAIKEWLSAHAAGMSAVATAAEASRSGDLGYSYGTYAQGRRRRGSGRLRPRLDARRSGAVAAHGRRGAAGAALTRACGAVVRMEAVRRRPQRLTSTSASAIRTASEPIDQTGT